MRDLVQNIVNKLHNRDRLVSNKYVVYTAIVNDYDNLIEPENYSEEIDYICFTDNKNIQSAIWQIVHIDFKYRNPRRLAKIFKVFPHLFFSNYVLSIWVDASVNIKGDLIHLIINYTNDADFTCFRHFKRDCLYDEADECMARELDKPEIINNQVTRYVNDRYPKLNGLIWGAVLIRNHKNTNVIDAMNRWWDEIENYSYRDQIAFNYIAWKYKLPINYLPFAMLDSPYFAYIGHTETEYSTIISRIKSNILRLLYGDNWVSSSYKLKQRFKTFLVRTKDISKDNPL
jgi:hypothetical protein